MNFPDWLLEQWRPTNIPYGRALADLQDLVRRGIDPMDEKYPLGPGRSPSVQWWVHRWRIENAYEFVRPYLPDSRRVHFWTLIERAQGLFSCRRLNAAIAKALDANGWTLVYEDGRNYFEKEDTATETIFDRDTDDHN